MTGALLLCGHVAWFAGCGVADVGAFLFPGSVPQEPARTYTAVGVRLGMEAPVRPWFLIRVAGELLPTINPASIVLNGRPEFQVAGWNAGLGIGALFSVGRP